MKFVVVGGASTYTPELVDGFVRLHEHLPLRQVTLVDPAADRLGVVAQMCRRLTAAAGDPFVVETSTDLDEALVGADVVLLQLRVGGQETRQVDEHLPLDLGCIGQETTGVGGLAKALRTVPVVLDIAERVAAIAPDAWIVNFTNPVGIVTRALLEAGHRAVGLCNVAIAMQHFFADLAGVRPEEVASAHVGLNHLSWELEVRIDGRDLLPELLARHPEEIAERVKLPVGLISQLGVVPSYYLRFYHQHDSVLQEQRSTPSRAEEVRAIESELLELYRDPTVTTKPEALSRRGGALYSEAAVQLAASLVGGQPGRHVVNVRNDGALDFLPDDAVVEVPAQVAPGSVEVVELPAVPAIARGLIADVYAYEELALEAAVHGGRGRVVDALLAHPLIRQWPVAAQLADRVIDANRAFLGWAR